MNSMKWEILSNCLDIWNYFLSRICVAMFPEGRQDTGVIAPPSGHLLFRQGKSGAGQKTQESLKSISSPKWRPREASSTSQWFLLPGATRKWGTQRVGWQENFQETKVKVFTLGETPRDSPGRSCNVKELLKWIWATWLGWLSGSQKNSWKLKSAILPS